MLTFQILQQQPQQLESFAEWPCIIRAARPVEVVQNDPAAGTAIETAVFAHETIAMMKADRAEQLQHLRAVIAGSSEVFPLTKVDGSFWAEITLGRSYAGDIVLEDQAISKLHAEFLFGEEAANVRVQDAGSSNGTFLNRVRLQPHVPQLLRNGDCLRFGQSIFYFVSFLALRELVENR